LKIPSEITFETTETNWVCMIVFLCAYVRISISTYILTSIVTYRIGLRPFKSETVWQAARHNVSGKQPVLVWSARWHWQW